MRHVKNPRIVGKVDAQGKRVRFPHPQTGQQHSGQVVGAGHKGVTVRDDEGQHHRVDHGRYLHEGADVGAPNDEAQRRQQGEERHAHARRFERLSELAGKRFSEFEHTASRHMRLGLGNAHAHRAAAALLSAHLGRHAHDLERAHVFDIDDDVNVRNQDHDTKVKSAPLAAFLRAHHRVPDGKVEDVAAPAFGTKDEPVEAQHVDEYLQEYLGHDMQELRRFHATRKWADQAAKLGKPRDEEHAKRLSKQASFAAGVDHEDVDPTVRLAHQKRGIVPEMVPPGTGKDDVTFRDGNTSHMRLHDYLAEVRRADPHGLRKRPEDR